jgi:tetratricopeptide (TPR) repeat protein
MEYRTQTNLSLPDFVSEFESMILSGTTTHWDEKDYLNLVRYYLSVSLTEKALEALDYALQFSSHFPDFYVLKSRLLMQEEDFKEADETLDIALNLYPRHTELQLMKIRVTAQLGDYEKAFTMVDRCSDQMTLNSCVDLYLAEAYIYECMREYNLMYNKLRDVLTIDPKNEEALEHIWVCVEWSRLYEECIEFHNSLIDQDAYNYLAWFNLGHAYSCDGDYKNAIRSFEYSFIVNPDFKNGYLDCAELCCQIKDYKKALGIYQELLQRFGHQQDYLVPAAECMLKLRKYALAKECLIEALKIDQYIDDVYYLLGICYAREGNYTNAISALIKAIKLDGCREEYYAELAYCYEKTKQFGKADFYYAKSTESGPEDDSYWLAQVKFLLRRNKMDKALHVLEVADEHTVSARLSYCKAACLYRLGKKKEAIQSLDEILPEDFDAHRIFFKLAPKAKTDRDIQSVIRYYALEN